MNQDSLLRPETELANDTAEPFGIGAARWPGLAKLAEECGEVVQVVAKLVATGGEVHHWSGDDLGLRLIEEMGDLMAAIEYVRRQSPVRFRNATRQRGREKLALFEEWHAKVVHDWVERAANPDA